MDWIEEIDLSEIYENSPLINTSKKKKKTDIETRMEDRLSQPFTK